MGQVTFQVLDGIERGITYRDRATPVSLGREEENSIRLNDERVSRFHAKVQEHNGQYILTDLDSTNGTRVNGHPVKMHVLNIGDQVLIGRCLLLFGSQDEILMTFGEESDVTVPIADEQMTVDGLIECPSLFPNGRPPLPVDLTPFQTAQMSDIIAFAHSEMLRVLYAIQADSEQEGPPEVVCFDAQAWHRMQQLEAELAGYLKNISEPE